MCVSLHLRCSSNNMCAPFSFPHTLLLELMNIWRPAFYAWSQPPSQWFYVLSLWRLNRVPTLVYHQVPIVVQRLHQSSPGTLSLSLYLMTITLCDLETQGLMSTFAMTRKWSEPSSADMYALKFFSWSLSLVWTRILSIWFMIPSSGEIHVTLLVLACWNTVLVMTMSLITQHCSSCFTLSFARPSPNFALLHNTSGQEERWSSPTLTLKSPWTLEFSTL